jgi:hypothetical protein
MHARPCSTAAGADHPEIAPYRSRQRKITSLATAPNSPSPISPLISRGLPQKWSGLKNFWSARNIPKL